MSKTRLDVPLSGAAGGYPGHHASNPNMLPQLMEAADNCLNNYCQVQDGEKVLVVAEPDTDPLVVASFASAAALAGAEVATMTVSPFSAGGSVRGQPSDMLVGAFERSDLIIACTYFEFAHADKTFFNRIFGSERRVCSVLMGSTPGCLVTAGRFPVELFNAIGDRLMSKLQQAETVRYVTDSGTDLVFRGIEGLSYSRPLTRGTWSIFPQMGVNWYPKLSDGVFVFDESTLTGRPRQPIAITVKDNYVVSIDGGSRADLDSIDIFANGRYYVRHTVIGLNPKIRMEHAPQFERERAAGTSYLGIDGTGEAGEADLSAPGYAHLDVIFDTPTVYIDDEMVVDRRKLLVLEDPEIQEMAKQYGDPRRILAQNAFIW